MTIRELNPAAKQFVLRMPLDADDKTQIENCISRYSTPDSFCEFLNYLIYLVENVFKSVLGTSDWQMAINTIHANALEKAKEKNYISQNPQTEDEKGAYQVVSTYLRLWSIQNLDLALQTQNYNPELSDDILQRLNELSLDYFFQILDQALEKRRLENQSNT
jgi:hypothetical protein